MSSDEHLDYSMLIEWSAEDQLYLVTLPEWAASVMQPVTHGTSYEEAVKNGREVLEMLIESAREEGEPLPAPRTFASASASPAGT
jgi:predicted RNase H-like HicB family nuclease